MEDPQSAWTVWLMLGIALLAVEILLAGGASGVLFALAVMAFAGMGMALAGASLAGQIAAAIVIGLASLPLMILVFRRFGRGRGGPPTVNDAAMRDTAFEAYYDPRGHLRVRAHGEAFMAEPERGAEAIADGAAVQIVRFEGTRAIVRPVAAEVGARLEGD